MSFDGSGNLYILDRNAPQVVVIDQQGQLVRTIGQAGEGPGEFLFPTHFAVWRDGRMAVWDVGHRAFLAFGPGGVFDRSIGMGHNPGLTPMVTRPDPNGGGLYLQGSSGPGGEEEIDDFGIVRIDLTTDDVAFDPVLQARRALREDPPTVVMGRVAGVALTGPALDGVFFEPTLRWDVLPDGTVVYADSSAYTIKVLVSNVQEVEVVLRPVPPAGVSDRPRSNGRLAGSRECSGTRVPWTTTSGQESNSAASTPRSR